MGTDNTISLEDQAALLQQIRISYRWVSIMIFAQLLLAVLLWFSNYVFYAFLHIFFVGIGVFGGIRLARTLIFTHLVYSSTLTIFLAFALFFMSGGVYLYGVLLAAAYLFIQVLGIKHERALLVLISLYEELKTANLETVVVPQPRKELPEEQQPFIVYEAQQQQQQQPQMTEEEEMQQIIAMIQAREAAEAMAAQNVVPPQFEYAVPVQTPAELQQPTFPQFPFVYPPQQPVMYSPYQVNPSNEQPFYPPMMPTYPPYPGMMMMMPPPNMYSNNKQ